MTPRPRLIEYVDLPDGAMKDLRDALYRLYLAPEVVPRLDVIHNAITVAYDRGDHQMPGAPGRDVIGDMIAGRLFPAKHDAVAVAVALARMAGQRDTDIADQVRDLWVRAATAPTPVRLGRPVIDCDPLDLEVHRAIRVSGSAEPENPLPAYVVRAHDEQLRQVADRVMAGASVLVVLVGNSSTGKTRACWELARHLDQQEPNRWWLWHPYCPTHPDATLADLDRVGPYTIVWLNEIQRYLAPPDTALGERVAAGLRTLISDPQRGPVLVLATAWRDEWSTLTVRPPTNRPDPHAQARALLTRTPIEVGDVFTADEMAGLDRTGVDPRLREAAVHAKDGRITQYLAGVPELDTRYRTAPSVAKAMIHVAMDARRLGHPQAIPRALLAQAVRGYLDETTWSTVGAAWPSALDAALTDLGEPAHGILGPLTRIHPRRGDEPDPEQPSYRLADHLEQIGRIERRDVYPHESLWKAFTTTVTDPELLRHFGQQAEVRGRYQRAIWLYSRAADAGDLHALQRLAGWRERAGDPDGAEAVLRQAADRGDTGAMCLLAQRRERVGDAVEAQAWYRQAADRGSADALRDLARWREAAGELTAAEALYRQAAGCGHIGVLRDLTRLREKAGDRSEADALAVRAAELGDTLALMDLAQWREQIGDTLSSGSLYRCAAEAGNPDAWHVLAALHHRRGEAAAAEACAVRAAGRGNADALYDLGLWREGAGDLAGAQALYQQAADRGHAFALELLVERREQAGDSAAAEALYWRAAEVCGIYPLVLLAQRRALAGDLAGADAVYHHATERGHVSGIRLRGRLHQAVDLVARAEALYRQAIDCGDAQALHDLAGLWTSAGEEVRANRLLSFGLTETEAGEPATGLDFGGPSSGSGRSSSAG